MIHRVVITLLCLLVIAGCSSTKLAYRYADWGIVWWVDDYIPLTVAQEKQLDQDIHNLRQWHCTTELPAYTDMLAELKSDVLADNLGAETIARHQQQIFSLLPPLIDRVQPAAVRLLDSLSDDQVKQLASNMEASQKEREDEFLLEDPQQTRDARAERTIERAERWLGSLNEQQQESVSDWSDARGNQTRIWLEGRRQWQQALLKALELRGTEEFPQRIRYLIDNSESIRGDEYKQMMIESRKAMANLITELLTLADERQLDHLTKKITNLSADFAILTCEEEPSENNEAQKS